MTKEQILVSDMKKVEQICIPIIQDEKRTVKQRLDALCEKLDFDGCEDPEYETFFFHDGKYLMKITILIRENQIILSDWCDFEAEDGEIYDFNWKTNELKKQ